MTRLAKLVPADLDADQRSLYDSITGGPRGQNPQVFMLTNSEGGLEGPFNAMLLCPPLGTALQGLGAAARYGSGLADRAREIVILVVAHHWGSEFEVHAHEAVGTAVGLNPGELALLREGRFTELADPLERRIALTAHALTAHDDLDDAEYVAAVDAVGPAGVFEITTIVGYYATLALQLRVYRVPAPDA